MNLDNIHMRIGKYMSGVGAKSPEGVSGTISFELKMFSGRQLFQIYPAVLNQSMASGSYYFRSIRYRLEYLKMVFALFPDLLITL